MDFATKCKSHSQGSLSVQPVQQSDAACAPGPAAAAGAAGRRAPVDGGMRSGSRQDDAAGGEGGPGLHTQEAIDQIAPEHLERATKEKGKQLV